MKSPDKPAILISQSSVKYSELKSDLGCPVSDRDRLLQSLGCYDPLPPDLIIAFTKVFLSDIYPALPIFNSEELLQQVLDSHIPLILSYAICFAVSSHLSKGSSILDSFSSQQDARRIFYTRAKHLFCFAYSEQISITTIQVCILLSFWNCVAPSEYWNSTTWLNTAIDIAESLGLHQLRVDDNTKFGTQIELETTGMCKRIWWTLVWRDAFGSVISGRPLRIDLSQCSTPRPHPLDPGQQQISQQVCDLGLILRSIIRFRFFNKDSKMVESFVKNTLRTLSSLNIPTSNSSLAMRLAYNHVLIYLCQTSRDFYEESSINCNPTIESFMKGSVEEVLEIFRMLLGSQSLTMVVIPLDVLGVCLNSGLYLIQVCLGLKEKGDTERLAQALESFGVVRSMLEMIGQQWDHAVQICALLDALNVRAELPLSLPLVEGSMSNLVHDERDNKLADSPVQRESLAYDEEAEKLLSMLWGYEEVDMVKLK